MRDDAIVSSNCPERGAGRARGGALKCVAGLVLALALSASGASAQGVGVQPSSTTNGRETAASAQQQRTRARRVAAANDSSKQKDEGGAIIVMETNAAAAGDKTVADEIEMTNEPPSATDEARGGDRLSTLRAQIRDAKDEAERTRLRRTLVDYLVALNRKAEAIDELRLALKDERFDPVGFYNIGNALVRLGDTDTAVDAYRKAIEQRRGHYSRASHNLGVVLMRQGRWDEAQEALSAALRQEAFRYPEASYNLGRLYSLRGEAALAIREWTRALSLQPDHTDAALALARAYAEDGNPERAINIIDSFTKRHGANDELTAARREILYDAEAEDDAGDAGARVVATKPATAASPATVNGNAPVIVSTSANASAARAKTVSGGKADNAAIRTNSVASGAKMKATEDNSRPAANNSRPASASLRSLTVDRETYDLLERARSAREAGKDAEAVAFYNRVLARRGGFFPPANLEVSFVLSELNRHEEAIASLQKLITNEGARYPIAFFHLGRQYEAIDQLGAAATAYSRAAAAYGEREPQFLLDVSRVREKEGNIEAALAAMEEYARISGQHGRTPAWTAERIAQLRQKKEAAKP